MRSIPVVAIGSEIVRWTVAGQPDRDCESLTYFWRDKLGELPAFVGELFCNRSRRYVPLPLGDWPDAEVAGPMAGLLREVRRGGTTSRWWRPAQVYVALSPALAARLAPVVPAAARAAGFRRAIVVDEAECLAAAAGPRRPLVVIDVGDATTRLLIWTGPSLVPAAATSIPVGGRRLVEDMRSAIRAAGLIIGDASARRIADNGGDWPRPTKGRDLLTERPRQLDVEQDTALAALGPAESEIAAAVACAPLPAGDVRLVLTGAAAAFVGLREEIASRTRLPVEVDAHPGAEVLRGLQAIVAAEPNGCWWW